MKKYDLDTKIMEICNDLCERNNLKKLVKHDPYRTVELIELYDKIIYNLAEALDVVMYSINAKGENVEVI